MTSPEASSQQRGLLGAGIAVVVAAVLVLLSMMVIIPPFTMAMLPFAIGSPEMSPFLVLFDLLWCLPANRLLRGRTRLRWTTLVLLVASACVAVRPLTQFNKIAAAASAQLGNDTGPPRFSLLTALRGLPASGDVVERTIPYAAPDGTRLSLRLYALGTRAVRPTVVVIYGGAWRNGAPTQAENVSRALAARGFAVAAIDYRHAPRAQFPAQIDDVNLSLALLRDSSVAWGLDVERMAVLGRSSGGHLAELSAYAPNGNMLRAVVALYAPFNLVEGYNDLPRPDPIDVRSVLRGFIGGTPDDRPRAYAQRRRQRTWRRDCRPRCSSSAAEITSSNQDSIGKPRRRCARRACRWCRWKCHGRNTASTWLRRGSGRSWPSRSSWTFSSGS